MYLSTWSLVPTCIAKTNKQLSQSRAAFCSNYQQWTYLDIRSLESSPNHLGLQASALTTVPQNQQYPVYKRGHFRHFETFLSWPSKEPMSDCLDQKMRATQLSLISLQTLRHLHFSMENKISSKSEKETDFQRVWKRKKETRWPWILMKASFSPLRQPRQGLWTSRICPRSQPSLLSAMVETSATSWQRSCLLDLENWLCFNVVCWFV